jgi:hypothetical protein
LLDIHTLGISVVIDLLEQSGEECISAPFEIESLINSVPIGRYNLHKIAEWTNVHNITDLCISYRLDPLDGFKIFEEIVNHLSNLNSSIKFYFAGLPEACEYVRNNFESNKIETFSGHESISLTLEKLGVDYKNDLRASFDDPYESYLENLSVKIYADYSDYKPYDYDYSNFGGKSDKLVDRIDFAKNKMNLPLTRVHVGPYKSDLSRESLINLFIDWLSELVESKVLDIVSIGTSQLTQEDFAGNWGNRLNGGGVPIHNEDEYQRIWLNSRPLLLRAYSATRNVSNLAKIHESSINIAWHALSFWWFNRLDERGPNGLLDSLREHFEATSFISTTNKPLEANVSHHFSFRGSDDNTYILSSLLCAKAAKSFGVKTFIVQNMLNTPRQTSFLNDIAKSRALLSLIKELEDHDFKVIFQPRAGLDYLSSDYEEAKMQLVKDSMLMDDVDPFNENSPEVIHVVSYSEGQKLSDPKVIIDSIKLSKHSISEYRKHKVKSAKINQFKLQIDTMTNSYIRDVKLLLSSIEKNIENTYSPEGFYKIFKAGYLPVPRLWIDRDKFPYAVNWKTKLLSGGVKIVYNNELMPIDLRIKITESNVKKLFEENVF